MNSEHGCDEKLRSTKGYLTLKSGRPENFCNAEGKMLVENKVVNSGQRGAKEVGPGAKHERGHENCSVRLGCAYVEKRHENGVGLLREPRRTLLDPF